ncbi:MAG: PD-(D/E)XK nuclease family protein [Bacteroidetes bacterium]|nr:PD-(D/E)XK nuclease family protein [Bacteroidota bacterium]
MSTVRLLSPSVNLVQEITSIVLQKENSDNDFSDILIVSPGKRPAHAVRKQLAGKLQSVFLPPQIFSIDVFVEHLCTVHLHEKTKPLHDLDAAAILFELHRELQQSDEDGKQYFSTLESFYAVGIKIYSELEELMMSRVSHEELRQEVRQATTASALTLSLLYTPFYEDLQRRGFSTRGMRYRRAAEKIQTLNFSEYSKIIFAGFYSLTPVEKELYRHLLTLPNVLMLFQNGEGIQTTLDELHIHCSVEGESASPEVYFYESPDAHGQIFALNSLLQKNLASLPEANDEAVIVLPNAENLFPLFHQTLSDFDQSKYNIALGYPLSRTPVYGFLLSLLDVITTMKDQKVFVPKYLQFLLHPYTKNILYKNRTDVTRTLIHSVERALLQHDARVYISLDEIETSFPDYLNITKRLQSDDIMISENELREHFLHLHNNTVRRLINVNSLGEFGNRCIDILMFINEYSTAHRHPYFRPFVEMLLNHLAEIDRSLLADYAFQKPEHYVLFLQHYFKSAEVPFTGTPLQGLQVLGFLETRGLAFKKVFILDTNDDILPGKSQQDVLLPLTIREKLGLSTYRDQEKIKTYIFSVLINSAEEVHLFYINSSDKEPSRFISRLQWSEQFKRKNLSPVNTKKIAYQVVLDTKTPLPIRKTEQMVTRLKEMRYSSTALNTYLLCGLKFYYQYVLRLKEKEEISGEVEQIDIGTVVHKILQEYFAPFIGKKLQPADFDAERLQQIIKNNFESFYGTSQFGEQFFAKRQTEKHLTEYFEKIEKQNAEKNSIEIESLETTFNAELDGFQLTGKADRIEQRNSITYILDYKTGSPDTSLTVNFEKLTLADRLTWREAIGSLQLPFYVLLYSSVTGTPPEKINAEFLYLGKKDLDETIEVSLYDTKDEAIEYFPQLKEIIFLLLREITNREIPFSPTNDIENDCPSCPYKLLCGTQWTDKLSSFY